MRTKLSSLDIAKWVGVLFIIAAITGGNVYYSSLSVSIRATVIIIASMIALLLAYSTQKGKVVFEFLKEARRELRKVIWPTRQETIQTTLMIAGIVILMSIILWGVDLLFSYIVSSVLI